MVFLSLKATVEVKNSTLRMKRKMRFPDKYIYRPLKVQKM